MLYLYRKIIVFTILLFIFLKQDSYTETTNYRWKEFNNGLISWNMVSVIVDHENPSTVYALLQKDGVYKSTDGGETLVQKINGIEGEPSPAWGHLYGNLLTMDPSNNSVIYTNFNGQVYKTLDGAENWININNGNNGQGAIDICAPNYQIAGVVIDPTIKNESSISTHLFAAHTASGCGGGIYESHDGGDTWVQIAGSNIPSSDDGDMGNDSWTLAIDPTDPSRLYSSPVYLGFLYSTDGGHTWTHNRPPGADGGATVVAVNPYIPNRIFLGHPYGIFVSEDYGITWTDLTSSARGGIIDIDFSLSDSNIVYAVGREGLFKSEDGGLTWFEVGNYSHLSLKSLAIHSLDPDIIYLGSTGSGLFKSTDGGVTLTEINNGLPSTINIRATAIAEADPNIYYCTIYGKGLYRSNDRGNTWILVSTENSITQSIYVTIDPDDPDILYAGLDKIFKSVDGGITWNEIFDHELSDAFLDFKIDPGNALVLYAVGMQSSSPYQNMFYKSTDGGLTWEPKWTPENGFTHYSRSVMPIVIDPADSSRIYVATYNSLCKSEDAGETWTRITDDELTGYNLWIDGLAVDPIEPNRVYMTTRANMLLYSVDYGNSWNNLRYAGGYPGRIIIDRKDHNTFYVFTLYSWQKYSVTYDGSSIIVDNVEIMPKTGITSPYIGRNSALQDPLDENRFIMGGSYQGFLIFDQHMPVISNIAATNVTMDSAIITWDTDEPSTSQVEYGTTENYGQTTPEDTNFVTEHSIILEELTYNTTYHFRVLSKDSYGSQATSADFTFKTLPDISPPVISEIEVVSITHNSAVIIFQTDEPSLSQVEYGTSTDYGQTTPEGSNYVTQHSIRIEGLSHGTTWHFRIISRDRSGNNTISADYTFDTLPDTAPPVISQVSVTSITYNSVIITWETDIPSMSKVEYGLTDEYGNLTNIYTDHVIEHSVELHGLSSETIYHFRVISGVSGNEYWAYSDDYTFTTLTDAVPPVIHQVNLSNILNNSAYVMVITDEPTTVIINYGTTTEYGLIALDSVLESIHNIKLENLLPGTIYHFQVIATDASGNSTCSSDYIFTTLLFDPLAIEYIPLYTDVWFIYDPAGFLENYYDVNISSDILSLETEDGMGFAAAHTGTDNFHKPGLNIFDKKYLSMLINTQENFRISVRVVGENGKDYYLAYTPEEINDFGKNCFFTVNGLQDGNWQPLVRDMDHDLYSREDTHLSSLRWFCVRGNVKIGEIKLLEEFPASIDLITPYDGKVVSESIIEVHGLCTIDIDEVRVNGRVTNVSGNEFYLDDYELDPGNNEITVIVYRCNGAKKEAVAFSLITVIYDPLSAPVIEIPLTGWFIFDPAGSIVNYYDIIIGKEAMRLVTDDGMGFAIAFTGSDKFQKPGLNISGKQFLTMLLNTEEAFRIDVKVVDENQKDCYLSYTSEELSDHGRHYYFTVDGFHDGKWRLLIRNMNRDLYSRRGTNLSSVRWICLRGGMKVSEIKLRDKFIKPIPIPDPIPIPIPKPSPTPNPIPLPKKTPLIQEPELD